MISDRDLNEALKAALMGRETEYTPSAESIAAEKARLGAMADGGVDMPAGTKVNFAPDAGVPASGAERMPIVPRVVDLTNQSPDDLEMAYARQQDREARAREAFERGARELVAGITRTQVAPTFQQPTDAVSSLLAARKTRAEDAQRNEANRLNAAKFNFERSEAARKEAEAKAKDERDFAYRQQHDTATLEQQAKNAEATRALAGAGLGLRKQEAERKTKEEADKEAAGVVPFVGGTLKMTPGLSDSERSKARDYASSWNAAITNVDGVRSALDSYLAKPTIEGKGVVESQLVGALTALNVAYKQGAMADTEARRLSSAMGVDLTSPQGIAAAVSSWLSGDPGEAGRILKAKIDTLRSASRKAAIESLRPYGGFEEDGQRQQPQTQQPAGPVSMKFPDGSVHDVAPEDMELAKRKGAVPNG